MAQKRRIYCKFCEYFCYTPEDFVSHLEKKHSDYIPEDMTPWQFSYYLRFGKTHGSCIVCHSDTTWNESTHKYNRFCNKPECKEKYRELFKKRMIGKYGKTTLLNDPEQQKKMLANRKISGEYLWRDHVHKTPYTGSYEKSFLEFLDSILNFDPNDVMAPSPHTYYYTYEGKAHFYIPDFFIPSLQLEIEIKDGGDNPNMHHKIQDVDKVKEKLKDDVMTHNQFNYIKIVNKNNMKILEYLSKAKDQAFEDEKSVEPIYILESVGNIDKDITEACKDLKSAVIAKWEDSHGFDSKEDCSVNKTESSNDDNYARLDVETTSDLFSDSKITKSYGVPKHLIDFFSKIIETNYVNTDAAHDKRHIYQVTNAMLFLGNKLELDIDLCIAIGSLHDIGLNFGKREDHHINSAKWIEKNRHVLKKFYSDDKIDIMKTAVSEHRSSLKTKSNIYSEAITDADKIPSHNIENIILRAWIFTKFHNPEFTDKEAFESTYSHIHEKYGKPNIYGNKFYTKYAIQVMAPTMNKICKYTNNKKLCLEKLKQLIGDEYVESEDLSKIDKDHKRKSIDFGYKSIDIYNDDCYKYFDKSEIDYYRKAKRHGEILVETDQKSAIGYIYVRELKGKNVIGPFKVFDYYKGYGFGEILLKDAIKKYDANSLNVFKDNEVAIALYNKMGFKKVSETDDYITMEL